QGVVFHEKHERLHHPGGLGRRGHSARRARCAWLAPEQAGRVQGSGCTPARRASLRAPAATCRAETARETRKPLRPSTATTSSPHENCLAHATTSAPSL